MEFDFFSIFNVLVLNLRCSRNSKGVFFVTVPIFSLLFQLFAIQLASYLCLQFPLPKAMGVARYILSRLSSLLATLPASKRSSFFTPALPTLVRFCRAFPPLCDEATGFLLELGRVAASHASASASHSLGMLLCFIHVTLSSHALVSRSAVLQRLSRS